MGHFGHCREYKGDVAIDGLKLVNSWGSSGLRGSKLPVSIGGLLLEGCSFEGGTLKENAPNSPTVIPMPAVTLAWLPKDGSGGQEGGNSISLPVYLDSRREKLLTRLSVPAGGQPDRWIKAGAALFLKN